MRVAGGGGAGGLGGARNGSLLTAYSRKAGAARAGYPARSRPLSYPPNVISPPAISLNWLVLVSSQQQYALAIVGGGQPSGSHAPIGMTVTPEISMVGSPQTEVAAGPSGAGPGAGAGSADACTERSSAMIGSRAYNRSMSERR